MLNLALSQLEKMSFLKDALQTHFFTTASVKIQRNQSHAHVLTHRETNLNVSVLCVCESDSSGSCKGSSSLLTEVHEKS